MKKRLGELVKRLLKLENANMFDDPMDAGRKEYQREEVNEKFTTKGFTNEDKNQSYSTNCKYVWTSESKKELLNLK